MTETAASSNTPTTAPSPSFVELLRGQIRTEFNAHQQYLAVAVWFDHHDLPQLASHFYRQAMDERNHALMFVQYMLDRGIHVAIPGADEVQNDFDAPIDLIRLSLKQEQDVTAQIERLFKAARAEGDFIAEQFILWFLKEQVEEVASMNTLLQVAERAGDQPMWLEDFLAREAVGDPKADAGAPPTAGPRV
jgi:bacterioferritin B